MNNNSFFFPGSNFLKSTFGPPQHLGSMAQQVNQQGQPCLCHQSGKWAGNRMHDHCHAQVRPVISVPQPGGRLMPVWSVVGSSQRWTSDLALTFPFRKLFSDFPGGAVVKNPPANAGDTGSSPGPGRSHMPWSN